MVICVVVGCSKRSGRDDVSFYRIPFVDMKRNYKYSELILRRQKLWITRIKRADLDKKKIKHGRICSLHFISGKPSSLQDVNNPDWAPSVNLGYRKGENATASVKRFRKNPTAKQTSINASRRADWTPSSVSVLCNEHFSEDQIGRTSLVTECLREKEVPKACKPHLKKSEVKLGSADHPKASRTATAPLDHDQLKKNAVSLLSLPSSSKLPIMPPPDGSLKSDSQPSVTLQKEVTSTVSENSVKNLAKKKRPLENEMNPAKKNVKKKQKESSKETTSNSVKDVAENHLNENLVTSSNENLTVKSFSGVSSTQSQGLVSVKVEKPWEEEYSYVINPADAQSKSCDEIQIEINNVRSVSSKSNSAKAGKDLQKIPGCSSTSVFEKPLKIRKRDELFGKLVASEISDLYDNSELYLKTKQAVLNVLVQAHYEQMKLNGIIS